MARMQKTVIVIVPLLILVSFSSVLGSEITRAFLDGTRAYREQRFDEAVRKFQNVADSGIRNGKLFYNLGNAYLKSGDLGRAILWYERASRLIPQDADLRFNLDYARSLTKDRAEEQASPAVRVLFFWNYLFSPRTVQVLALVFGAIFWLLLLAGLVVRRSTLRTLAYAAVIPLVVFAFTALFNAYEGAASRRAVVLPAEIAVRSGLTDNSTKLFALHAGTTVRIEKERSGRLKIRFSKNKIGWIPKEAAGQI